MNKRLPAYTMIEILVVMSIIAILSGLGAYAMMIFRQTAQLQSAANDLAADMQEYRNMARNSVPSLVRAGSQLSDKIVDGYAIYFQEDNYHLVYCVRLGDQQGQFQCNVSASGLERANQKREEYRTVRIYPEPNDVNNCRTIMFARRSGNIYSLSEPLSTPTEDGICRISITHLGNGQTLTMQVNLTDNIFNIVR